jgi:vitamin K-dependent gamma-carboxylase
MALTSAHSRIRRFNAWLQSPEDGACLAVFRAAFGMAMAWDASQYISKGWAWTLYCKPDFLFKYYGFEWVTPLPEFGMFAVHAGMFIAGALIALGAYYRTAITYFFLAHTYVFLLSATQYLNHAYLISLVAFLLMWMPANRCFSVDAWRDPELRARPTPRWCRFTLQTQVAIVYVFGAVAKLNADWIAGVPIGQWLGYSAHRNPLLADLIAAPVMIPMVVWGGILFDLLIVPLLLWRRTRWLAIGVSICFHVANSVLFEIGVFPWMMLGATTLFFAADWPRRVPGLRALLDEWEPNLDATGSAWRWLWLPVALWFAVQIAMPLRHHLYPGSVAWTEEGHQFSWRMKLRSKRGWASFRVLDPVTGNEWRIYPEDELDGRQAQKLAGRPDLIIQYARRIGEFERERLGHDVEVRVDAFMSLNYRPPQRYIDPEVDLSKQRMSLRPYPWILPFEWTPPPTVEARPAKRPDERDEQQDDLDAEIEQVDQVVQIELIDVVDLVDPPAQVDPAEPEQAF